MSNTIRTNPFPLQMAIVPHWGWRAREGQRTFEIERVSAFGGRRGDRLEYIAFVRQRGQSKPIAQQSFGTTIAARRWLESQREQGQ